MNSLAVEIMSGLGANLDCKHLVLNFEAGVTFAKPREHCAAAVTRLCTARPSTSRSRSLGPAGIQCIGLPVNSVSTRVLASRSYDPSYWVCVHSSCELSLLVTNVPLGQTSAFYEQLYFARVLHQGKQVRSFINCGSSGQQSVILQRNDSRFFAHCSSDPYTLLSFEDNATKRFVDSLYAPESAGILVDDIQRFAECGPCLTSH
jgi:hypothetical protein